jgi:hypothetical protein
VREESYTLLVFIEYKQTVLLKAFFFLESFRIVVLKK